MTVRNSITNNKGFSLIELMVVVAIIGILAAVAIPNISKYMNKAKQSEAKVNLSSIYMSEKAYFAEANTYSSTFATVGYVPEGEFMYDLGFTTGDKTNGNCIGSTGGGTPAGKCTYKAGGGRRTLVAADCAGGTTSVTCVAAAASFTAGASAQFPAADVWTIDEAKKLAHPTAGE